MKKIKKLKKENKNSILGIVLAFILLFTFNYSPISLISSSIANSKKASAYSSSTSQTYYGDGSVKQESSVNAGLYADGTSNYFTGSTNNYNILKNYNERYNKLFKQYVNDFLLAQDKDVNSYNGVFALYLKHINHESISSFYEANSSASLSSYASFREYFESFVTSEYSWVDSDDVKHTLPAIWKISDTDYKSKIYNSLANYLENKQIAIEGNDGITSNDVDFYTVSVSFNRVKTFIDNKITETTVITNYDGKTQDDYVAAIIADKAPVVQGFYYDDKDLTEIKTTDFNYKQESYPVENSTTVYKPKVYYFGSESELSSAGELYTIYKNSGYRVDTSYSISELESNSLYYRPIQKGEFGYFSGSHPTYYAYEKIPYDMTNSIYELYVVDDNVTESEQVTYDSLYYVHVISSDEITNDKLNIKEENGYTDTSGCFYVQVPYLGQSNNYSSVYFKKLFSTISTNDFARIVSLFTKDGNSLVYFKISSNSYTTTKDIVYLDTSVVSIEDFMVNNPNYNYIVEELKLDDLGSNPDGLTMKDYSAIEYGSAAYVADYPLYHKKNRHYFETTTNEYSGYHSQHTPVVEYEKTDVSSNEYVKDLNNNNKIYALVDELEIDNVKYPVVSKDLLENNTSIYDEITDNSSLNSNYKFFYKHTTGDNGNINLEEYETLNGQKIIYVYVINVTLNDVTYDVITSKSLSLINNLYVKVPTNVADKINGEDNSYTLYYKHTTTKANQIYIIDDATNAVSSEVYKNLNYKVIKNDEYKATYYKYIAVATTDANYNKNFKLYYKLDIDFEDYDSYSANSSLFIQNAITNRNAIFIVDDSLTSTEKASYKSLYFTAITTKEFEAESDFYVLINENDNNYNSTYTKLYYKYVKSTEINKTVYIFSKDKSATYQSFYSSDSDYNADDYELIEVNDPNYVAGLELYYKKKVVNTLSKRYEQNSYYYFKTSSSVTLNANSYYLISFYAYTNGNYYDENGDLQTNDIQATFHITDNDKVISDVTIENISTNGKWVQYNAFIATDAITNSKIYMYMYLGNLNSIAGNTNAETVSGTVLFDNIKITLIGETDYINKSVDAKPVQDTITEEDTTTEKFPIVTQANIDEIKDRYEEVVDLQIADNKLLDDENTYYYKHNVDLVNSVLDTYEVDEDGNKVIYVYQGVNDSTATTKDVTIITNTTTYENVDKFKNSVIVVDETMIKENQKLFNRTTNNSIIPTWNEDYNFDSSLTLEDRINSLTFAGDEDGFTSYVDWHYYISRSNSGQGNNEILKAYRQAYLDKKATISVIKESEIDKTVKEEDEKTETETDKKDDKENDKDKTDVPTIESTFGADNKVLKIDNTDRLKSLGIASNTFTINQGEYYKVTVWIYSPDKDATATIKVESILKTASTTNQGTLLSGANSGVSACLSDYSKAPTNEYSWIPVSFMIEGNVYHNQDIYLVLLADADSTVYFDNITIEKTTSTKYDSTNSDSDELTTCFTLSPTNSVVSSGITNGYFNLSTLTKNYINVDHTVPRAAENWTVTSGSSANAVAGVVSTSNDYLNATDNFFTKYNNGEIVSTNGFNGNLFAIYAPDKAKATIHDENGELRSVNNNYAIYSGSISLSATTLYEISFEFYAGHNFSGNMVASLYSKSVANANLTSQIKVSSEDLNDGWNKFTFYVKGGSASINVYLEIGVQEATGTCFFQKATSKASSYTTLEAARDSLVTKDENVEDSTNSIYDYSSLSSCRFVSLADYDFSVHGNETNSNGVYDSTNYTDSNINTTGYTVGKSGTVVANYYTSSTSTHYTVKLDKYKFIKSVNNSYEIIDDADDTFYIKAFETTDSKTNETTITYKLYSDSMFTIEVVGFDINSNKKADDKEIGNFTITKTGTTVKITVEEVETETTTVNKTNYEYNFNNDVEFNNQIIPAEELKNNYSQNVLILANGNTTDYSSVSPRLVYTINKSSFYVLKIYVKTSEIVSLNSEKESGLNIKIKSVTVDWNNIDTTNSKNADENGFVCYELWLKTNTSSYSDFNVVFSLGSEKNPCSGYAIIAGVSLESFSNETLFNEYCDAKEELYNKDDADSIAKRFYGTESTSKDDSSDKEEDKDSSIWATFFYIFSSLLLGIVLIIALIAIIIKKHPIKLSKNKVEDNIIVVNSKEIDPKKEEKEAKKKAKQEARENVALDTTSKEETGIEVSSEEETNETNLEENTESQEESSENSESENVSENEAEKTTETEKKQDNNGDEGFL